MCAPRRHPCILSLSPARLQRRSHRRHAVAELCTALRCALAGGIAHGIVRGVARGVARGFAHGVACGLSEPLAVVDLGSMCNGLAP